MKLPKISVIIPVKNTLFLSRALCSVLDQKGNFVIEIIVVDDGASIRSDTMFSNVTVVKNKGLLGPGGARNVGLKQVTGDFIAFLDADDYWESTFVQTCLDKLKNNQNYVGVIGLSSKRYELSVSISTKFKLIILNLVKDLMLVLNYMLNYGNLDSSFVYLSQLSHMMFARKRIKNTLFDSKYKYCEDWKFTLDVLKRGNVGIIPKAITHFRYSGDSYSFSSKSKNTYQKSLYYDLLLSEMKNSRFNLGTLWFSLYTKFLLIS